MKNLNKKIGAVALAGMVVFGGVAASGAQSFAYGRYHGGIRFENEMGEKDRGSEKLEELIKGYGFKASVPFHNRDFLIEAVQDEYPSSKKPSAVVPVRKGSKMLDNILSGGYDVIMVRFEGKFYAIVNSN